MQSAIVKPPSSSGSGASDKPTSAESYQKKRSHSSRSSEPPSTSGSDADAKAEEQRQLRNLRDRANRVPNMAVIDEAENENGGTLFMDNIKLKVKEQKRKESAAVDHKKKAVPHSVDLLLKKQDKLCKDILYSEQKQSRDKP